MSDDPVPPWLHLHIKVMFALTRRQRLSLIALSAVSCLCGSLAVVFCTYGALFYSEGLFVILDAVMAGANLWVLARNVQFIEHWRKKMDQATILKHLRVIESIRQGGGKYAPDAAALLRELADPVVNVEQRLALVHRPTATGIEKVIQANMKGHPWGKSK